MRIERLDLSDPAAAEELWALQHDAFRREAALIGVADLPPLRDTVETLQTSGETFYGCWTEDGEMAGAVSVEDGPEDPVVICRMMVRTDHARQGIGSRLLRHVISLVPEGRELAVTAEVRNEPAIRLYERNGFRPAGTWSPEPGITMLRLTRRIL